MKQVNLHYLTLFGSEAEKREYIKNLSPNQKEIFVKEILEALTFQRAKFSNYDIDKAADTILNTYTEDEFFDFAINSENFLNFIGQKEKTESLLASLLDIIESNGVKSIKNVLSTHTTNKNETNLFISQCLSQTYQTLLNYKFLLCHQLFNKLCDDNSFINDVRFQKIIDDIRKQTGKLEDIQNKNIARIIRNGIAHMDYIDDSNNSERCSELEGLKNNSIIKISSKNGNEFIVLNFKHINELSGLMSDYIKHSINTINLPAEYYYVTDNNKMKLILDKYNNLRNNPKLEPFEKEFINNYLVKHLPEYILTPQGFASLKTTIEYPDALLLQQINIVLDMLDRMDHSRNKTNKNELNYIIQSIPTLLNVYLLQTLSQLIDRNLVKNFVDDNMDSELFKNLFPNSKRKSIINKFRLLRNSLTHSYILSHGNTDELYDVDEKGVKIYVGKLDSANKYKLYKIITNYIMHHYDKLLDEFKTKLPPDTKNLNTM